MASAGGGMGYFQPGTKVQVGSHRVVVERYLSEGGFAHVYVVRVPTAEGGSGKAVLKRVAVPDKEALANMRTEVETMKKLKGHKHIVTYIDSHASQLKGGGYEVFLLMEFCDGGGLIDFMNTRLKNRLTEPEILKIFSDAAEGVACMHYLKPPLLHRDLKVENILISNTRTGKLYKLCDFGSTAPPRPAVTSAAEGRLIEDDVQRHTTLQYRSPEMIDVYRRRPIDEKADIWALGVLLYKLCYYTTPFEAEGQTAILSARFRYPPYPQFSDRLKKLIADMLTEDPKKRPTIYQVIEDVCSMRGREVPIKDIYATRSPEEARSNQRLPSPEPNVKPDAALKDARVPVEQTKQAPSDITPMRRGRPVSSAKQSGPTSTRQDRDPFAALDSPSFDTRSKAVDVLSSRFPPAERFSILEQKRPSFDFQSSSKTPSAMNDKVTNALADEVFQSVPQARVERPAASPIPDQGAPRIARAVSLKKTRPVSPPRVTTAAQANIEKPLPLRPGVRSSTPSINTPDSPMKPAKPPVISDRPIWRVPSPKSDRPRLLEPTVSRQGAAKPRPSSQSIDRSAVRSPASSRPSLEGIRPSMLDVDRTIHRSRSADEPALSPTKAERRERMDDEARRYPVEYGRDSTNTSDDTSAIDESRISTVEYLKELESESALPPRNHHRKSSTLSRLRNKHTSMPPTAVPAKNMFGGKFGNAFKMFEGGGAHRRQSSKSQQAEAPLARPPDSRGKTPPVIEDDLNLTITETEDLSPEMRRELERRRLSLEERRVAEAGAAHRAGFTAGARPPPNKASAIQYRVRTLLDESGQTSPVKKSASGYGRYTEELESLTPSLDDHQPVSDVQRQKSLSQQQPPTTEPPRSSSLPQGTLPSKPLRSTARPNAPPKPVALKTGAGGSGQTSQFTQPRQADASQAAAKARPPAVPQDPQAVITGPSELDWEYDFSRRYPNLSLDLAESEIAAQQPASRTSGLRVRDV